MKGYELQFRVWRSLLKTVPCKLTLPSAVERKKAQILNKMLRKAERRERIKTTQSRMRKKENMVILFRSYLR